MPRLPEQGTLAVTTRHHGPHHPATIAARREFEVARLAEHIQRTVDAAPPLTGDQRARLTTLLAVSAPVVAA